MPKISAQTIFKGVRTYNKRSYMEKFIIGVAVGMAAGALIVANNCKLRNLVKKNQEDLMEKAENYIDSKLEQMDKTSQNKKSQKSAENN